MKGAMTTATLLKENIELRPAHRFRGYSIVSTAESCGAGKGAERSTSGLASSRKE